MRKLLLAVAAAGILVAPAVAQAQSPVVIKFSHVVANDTPKGKGALKFKELAEKYTDGKVKIEVYPNSSLYKDKEEIEALQLGAVQMLGPSTAKFAPLGAKEFEAMDLPFAFADDAAYLKTIKGDLGKFLFSKLESKGIKGLAFWDNGFHMVSANKPILNPADFQGLKVRISGSKVADQYFRKLGSIPQILAFSEVYQALQTGVVDGCENTPSNYLTQKFHEVQKHITVSNHAHLQYAVIVNQNVLECALNCVADVAISLRQRPQHPELRFPVRRFGHEPHRIEDLEVQPTRDPPMGRRDQCVVVRRAALASFDAEEHAPLGRQPSQVLERCFPELPGLVAVIVLDGRAECHRAPVILAHRADLPFDIPLRLADEHLLFMLSRHYFHRAEELRPAAALAADAQPQRAADIGQA